MSSGVMEFWGFEMERGVITRRRGLRVLLLACMIIFFSCSTPARRPQNDQLKGWWALYLQGEGEEWEKARAKWLASGESASDLLVLNIVRDLVDSYVKRDFKRMERARKELVVIGEPAIPCLIQSFSRGGDFRKISSEILILIGESAVSPLLEALQEENVGIKKGAILSLVGLGGERAVEPLIRLALQDPNWQVRIEAVHAVASMQGIAALPILHRALYDGDDEVRKAALQRLLHLPFPRVRPILEEALAHSEKSEDLQWIMRIKRAMKERQPKIGLED